ncbi:hypothetical protein DY970_19655 [Pseudomonas aeruginosa]|nr:hypothetical protein DY970_19655 [Pseudomonas aeruginosa]
MSKRLADRTGANRPWRDKKPASAGLLFGVGCGRFFSPSWEDSSSGKRQRLDSSAAFFYLQAGSARSRTTKKCRCQVFRANQEGLETVYGTVG